MSYDLPQMLARLRGLFEIAARPGDADDLSSVLAEIARTIGESLGYGTVAINLLRRAWDDFEVVAVHGRADAGKALLGQTTTAAAWEPVLVERFYTRGAYLIPKGAFDGAEPNGASYVPEAESGDWDPEDALFVPMRDSAGRLIGVLSVDAPVSGRSPGDDELDALVAVASYAARAVESAELASREAKRRRGLEELLEVSSRLTSSRSTQEILDHVCEAIAVALGFELVVIELADAGLDRYVPVASVGLVDREQVLLDLPLGEFDAVFDPAFEVEGCFLLPRDDALARVGAEPSSYRSQRNGSSAEAWNRHWLVVPLESPDEGRIGFIWADDPVDSLLPSTSTLQVLRTFANQAATALEASRKRGALERRTAELEALQETTVDLLERTDPVEILGAFVARAAALMGTPNGYLYTVDRLRNRLVLDVALGVFARHRGTELGRGEGLSGRVWMENRPIAIADYPNWTAGVPSYDGADLRAAAGVPLVVAGEVVGVLGVGYAEGDRRFGEAELALLSRLAHLAALVFERAQLSRRLQEERDYSTRLIESANALVVGVDNEGRIVVFNAEASRVTGYAPEEVIGRSAFAVMLPPELADVTHEQYVNHLVSGSLPETAETPILTKGGERRLISWRNRAFMVEGKTRGSISFGTDVTERRRLEEELRQSQKMEAVGRLAGGVAHDFNNLLTAITGYGELALEKLDDGSAVREHVFEMKRAGERAAGLTRQLLAFSRRQVLQPEVVNVNGVVSELERMLGRLLGAQIELVTELDPGIGSTKADPGQLEQVVMNLALNARDAMPGGGRLTIRTRNDPTGEFVLLDVCDTGHGMEPDTLEQAFEPFFTTKPPGEGTGLGLSTVYGIVKQTGGDVTAESQPGRGTKMCVQLPRVQASVEALDEPLAEPTLPAGSTVLLVEDEDAVRRLVAAMLQDAGYRVLVAENASAAIVQADGEDRIDVLLTDVVMPGLSGPDLASLLTELRPDLRVLFVSGYTADGVARNGRMSPDTAFLQKPFTRAELMRALGALHSEAGVLG